MLVVAFMTPAVVHAEKIRVPRVYPTIQAGIDAADHGDVVVVNDGVYAGDGNRNIDFRGKAITVRSKHGPESCIIDCEDGGRAFYFHSSEGSDSVLKGLTVTRGYVTGGGKDGNGGGMICDEASPTVINCSFRDNWANGGGAGVSVAGGGSPTFDSCMFVGNSDCPGYGGALNIGDASSPAVVNCIFVENLRANTGGAICALDSSNTSIVGCTIIGNSAIYGGGISLGNSARVEIANCIISDNSATGNAPTWGWGGGIVAHSYAEVIIGNCTISGNSATSYGGAISASAGRTTLGNCILWDNSAPYGGPQIAIGHRGDPCTLSVGYADVQGGQEAVYVGPNNTLLWGEGNINADPLFAAGPAGAYYLSQLTCGQDQNSPCIDAGDGTAKQLGLKKSTTCTAGGNDRNIVDMGYHYPR